MPGVVIKILSLLEVFDQKLFGGLVGCKLLLSLLRLLPVVWLLVDRVKFFHHTLVAIGVCEVPNNLARNSLTET